MGESKIPVNIKVVHRYVIIDNKGNIVEKGSFESKSFVYSFIGLLRCAIYGYGEMINLGGSYITVDLGDLASQQYPVTADENDDTYGILVGSGTSDTGILTHKLDSQIKNDVLKHYKCEVSAQYKDTGTNKAWFTISRTFENVSAGTVTINEIGIVIKAKFDTTYDYFLILRDTVAPKSLDPGWKITWNIEIYVTT